MSTRGHAIRRPRIRLTARGMILTVLVVALLVTAIFPIRTYFSERSQIASLEDRIAELNAANERLERKIHQLHDPNYLEHVARECLGMVRPGEVAFVVVPEHGSLRRESC
jgi:cell division protein FtsB